MSAAQETNLALFIDFDNVALGARDARQRFEIQIVLQRLLEKGKIIVKKAYADWSHHKEYLTDLHQAGIELIEIPAPQLSGKNSADIRLVVDAMDLCYGKGHLDTFVIVSGDSDFSPLVSKLRENGKAVIGVGVRNSSSHLLIANCDEFIFYDDLYIDRVGRQLDGLTQVPAEKRKLFDFLVATIHGLLRESRGVLYSSLIKDTMKRKRPDFDEHQHGYSNFGDLLEEAMALGLLEAVRDSRAGGTWVVTALGKGAQGSGVRRDSGRPRGERRRGGRGRSRGEGTVATPESATPAAANGAPAPVAPLVPAATPAEGAPPVSDLPVRPLPAEGAGEGSRRSRGRRRGRRRENGSRETRPVAPAAPAEASTAEAARIPPPSAAVPPAEPASAEAPQPAARGRRGGRTGAQGKPKPAEATPPAATVEASPKKKAPRRKAPEGEGAVSRRAPRKKAGRKPGGEAASE